jgi:hypothetical protein
LWILIHATGDPARRTTVTTTSATATTTVIVIVTIETNLASLLIENPQFQPGQVNDW